MSSARNAGGLRHVRRGVFLAAAFLVMAPFRVHAVSPAAEALFEEGRRLFREGRTDEACAKFAESLAQEVSSGTLLNLALCHETQGKVATAWAEYRAAARMARNQLRTDRAEAADARALALEPNLPRLTLTAERSLPGQKVLIDDDAIGEGALGVAMPIDPGSHRVTVNAPGHLTWTTTVSIEPADQRTLEIPTLEPEPAPAAKAPIPPAPEATNAPRLPAPSSPAASAGTATAEEQQPRSAPVAGWIVGGAGVVGLGVGTVFGLKSFASYRDADRDCPSHLRCSDAAISERQSAESAAWVSNVALGVGLVAVSVGAYFILATGSHPRPEKVTLRAKPTARGGWLGVSSAF